MDHAEVAARAMPKCLGCGEDKPDGCVVCWTCFKRRLDGKSYKWFVGTFPDWLMEIGRMQ